MTGRRLYFDHNGTSPLRACAREAMLEAMALAGNANAVHAEGRAARATVERARGEVAALAGVDARCVVFTSGATEAANLALSPQWRDAPGAPPAGRLLMGATEHAAVSRGHRFPADAVEIVPVDPDGVIDLAALDAALARAGGLRVMLALQAANNVTGVIQPVAEAARRVHAAGGLVVCDAVQSAGKTPLDMAALGADLLILAAHKLGGPPGVGALVRAREGLHCDAALVRGGGQEFGLRGGTHNVAGIAGFGAAAREAGHHMEAEAPRLAALRDALEAGLAAAAPDLVVFGAGAARLPTTSGVAVPGVASATSLMALDLAGLAVSAGSACSSGKVAPPSTLVAMGVADELALGLLRFSLGWSTTAGDVAEAVAVFDRAMAPLRNRLRLRVA